MKKITLLLPFIACFTFGQNPTIFSENYEFQPKDIAYMFGNDVMLREKPSTEANVLALLKISDPIEIVEKSATTMKLNGMESPWYKVKTKNKVGFVIGRLISLHKETCNNVTFLISLQKITSKLFLRTRIVNNNFTYEENVSELYTHEFSVKAYGNKGLNNVVSIFEINYLAEACGVNGGGIYLFYNGRKLTKVIDYEEVGDGDAYSFNETYIFPNEEGGVPNKIVYTSKVTDTKDSVTAWTETKTTRRLLAWNGQKVIPKINK